MPDYHGPIHLSVEEVRERVPAAVPGSFALGHARPQEGAVFIARVGRADSDLRATLEERADGRFTACFWLEAPTPEEAYAQECQLWHEMGGPDGDLGSDLHPLPPGDHHCPVCGG